MLTRTKAQFRRNIRLQREAEANPPKLKQENRKLSEREILAAIKRGGALYRQMQELDTQLAERGSARLLHRKSLVKAEFIEAQTRIATLINDPRYCGIIMALRLKGKINVDS